MEIKELEDKIKSYLEQTAPEYFEGVELYEKHTSAKRNVVINFHQRWRVGTMHEKLIYELEKMIGAKKITGRAAILKVKPVNVPFELFQETKEIAPDNFKYATKFNDLPEELQKLVVEKGQLYNSLDILKKDLALVGEVNDEKSLAKRKHLMKQMKITSDRIKQIHWLVKTFDNSGEIDADQYASLTKEAVPTLEVVKTDEENQGNEDEVVEEPITEEMLEEEFKYKVLNYWQRKDMLTRLRSSVPRQEDRAKAKGKPELAEKNALKAKLGRKMMEVLEKYFETEKEPDINVKVKKPAVKKTTAKKAAAKKTKAKTTNK